MTVDVIDRRYHEGMWVAGLPKQFEIPRIVLEPKKTALLVIDMQNGFCSPDSSVLKELKNVSPIDFGNYINRLTNIVIPNIQKILDFFRKNKVEVVYSVTQSLTRDGRDRLPAGKTLGLHFPPSSKEARVIDKLKLGADEIVFTRTSSGVFSPYANYYHILTSMGIEHLVLCGCCTDRSILDTIAALDELFGPNTSILVEDCCAAFNEGLHISAVRTVGGGAVRIASAESVINHMKDLIKTSSTK